MKTHITIKNLQKKIPIRSSPLVRIAKRILNHERADGSILSIVLVGNQKIKALNRKYLKKNYPTDVLAFDLRNSIRPAPSIRRASRGIKNIFGEIVISTDAVLKNSKTYKTTPTQELVLYIVHGMLHLFGCDDHARGDIKRMRRKERELLAFLKI